MIEEFWKGSESVVRRKCGTIVALVCVCIGYPTSSYEDQGKIGNMGVSIGLRRESRSDWPCRGDVALTNHQVK